LICFLIIVEGISIFNVQESCHQELKEDGRNVGRVGFRHAEAVALGMRSKEQGSRKPSVGRGERDSSHGQKRKRTNVAWGGGKGTEGSGSKNRVERPEQKKQKTNPTKEVS